MSSSVYTSDVTVDTANREQLVESIRLREQRLSANVDELVGRLHPKALAAQAEAQAKSVVINPDGSPKVERIALFGGIALAVAAGITLAVVKSRR
ncbi:DUF3618 domain-containing protein [Brevibacterium sp. 5221]|uniref:DUF3618 domain-containing protein n=1 Tax=Brevibacterium rongguiense TaxID=2695267 RepID=A0A6N9H9M9_9MICO|nr:MULTISPECIES: DUF3618 domain-containing protein [Brevibacterium]MYM20224.1 DUF3618 domain-containing protein [Brevibacterium rongguiense]WAL41441.1 DUF3618 domain-containing protein [Brevibacterium sp. BRM-1]